MINKSLFFRQFAITLGFIFAPWAYAQTPAQALFDAGLSGWFSTECTSPAMPPNPDTHKVEYLWQGAGASRELIQRVMVDQSKPQERLQRRVTGVAQLAPDLFRFNLEVLPKTATSPTIKTLRRITANEHTVIEQSRMDAGGKETLLAKDGKTVTGDSLTGRRTEQPVKPSLRCTLSEAQSGALSNMAVQTPSLPSAATTAAAAQRGPVKSVQVASPDGFSTDFPWGKATCNTAGEEGVWGLCTVLDDAAKPLNLPAIVQAPLGGFGGGTRTPQAIADAVRRGGASSGGDSEPLLLSQLQFGRVIKAPDGAFAFIPTVSLPAPATVMQVQSGDVFGYRVQWQNLSRYRDHQPYISSVLETPRGIFFKRQSGRFANQGPETVISREMQEEERQRKSYAHVVNREFPLPQSLQPQTRSSYRALAANSDDAMLSQSHAYFLVEPTDPAGRYVLQVWAGIKLLGVHTFEVVK